VIVKHFQRALKLPL